MDIQHIGNNKFIVELTKTDMEQLDITYDSMDYSDVETRRVIWTILDRVRRRTGKDVDPSGNLIIEAAPDNAGGCFLMFTVSASGRKLGTVISKNRSDQIFEFETADDMLDMLSSCGSDRSDWKFFTDGKRYRISLPTEKAVPHMRILKEYGKFIGKDSLTAASTDEYWKELTALSSEG